MPNNYFDVGYESNVGLLRQVNEDSLFVDTSYGIFAVSDGMGGYGSGDMASAIAVDTIKTLKKSNLPLSVIAHTCHANICQAAYAGIGSINMGATIVAAKYLSQKKIEIAWVGDSRAYIWNGSMVKQISKDHTYVQDLIDKNTIKPEEARNHPKKHLLSKALGAPLANPSVTVDSLGIDILPTTSLILCSDGLTKELDDTEISNILSLNTNNQYKANKLVEMACIKGGYDNISVIIVNSI